MSIGSKIAFYRKKLNITQENLAQQLQVTNQAVSKWESDQCCPDIQLLPRLSDIFGVSIDELFDRAPAQAAGQTLPWEDDGTLRVLLYVGHRMVGGGLAEAGCEYEYDDDVLAVISDVSVRCGDVEGNVTAAGDVTCDDVGGDVHAEGNVTCDDVDGDVRAEGSVTCDNIDGDAHAGTNITCDEISGSATAGGNIMCDEIGCEAEVASSQSDGFTRKDGNNRLKSKFKFRF